MRQYEIDYYKSLTLKQLVGLQTRLYDEYKIAYCKNQSKSDTLYRKFVDIKLIVKPIREKLSIKQENQYWNTTIIEIEKIV